MLAFLLENIFKGFRTKLYIVGILMEPSGSVVECLTQDQEAAGWSLTGVTALWSLSKTHLSRFSTGSTQEDPSLFNWKIVDGTLRIK